MHLISSVFGLGIGITVSLAKLYELKSVWNRFGAEVEKIDVEIGLKSFLDAEISLKSVFGAEIGLKSPFDTSCTKKDEKVPADLKSTKNRNWSEIDE